jgi:tetratricopeptide (TPR) repeat protein
MEEFEKALAGATLPLLAKIPMGRARTVVFGSAAALVLVVAGVLGVLLWPDGDGGWQPDPFLVAVVPFENRTGDPTLEVYGDIVAEQIGQSLAWEAVAEVVPVSDVRVTLSTAFPGQYPREVLSQPPLSAGTVVYGDFYLEGDSLAFVPHVFDSRGGRPLFDLGPIKGQADEPSAVIQEVGTRVSGLLAQELDPDYLGRDREGLGYDRPPVDPDVYREYKAGIDLYVAGGSTEESLHHLLRAFEMDPTWMVAGLDAFLELVAHMRFSEADSICAILEASRSLMSESQLWVFDFLKVLISLDFDTAYRMARQRDVPLKYSYLAGWAAANLNYMEQAVEFFGRWEKDNGGFRDEYVGDNPDYFETYSEALHGLERFDEELEVVLEGKRRFGGFTFREFRARIALGQIQEADSLIRALLDRADYRLSRQVAGELMAHGFHAEARSVMEEELRRLEDTNPSNRLMQAIILHWLGRDQDAHDIFEYLQPRYPQHYVCDTHLGITAVLTGDTAQALEVDQRLTAVPDSVLGGYSRGLVTFYRATLYAAMGDAERVVELLEQAIEEGQHAVIGERSMVHWDVDIMRLRGDPVFEDFIRPRG